MTRREHHRTRINDAGVKRSLPVEWRLELFESMYFRENEEINEIVRTKHFRTNIPYYESDTRKIGIAVGALVVNSGKRTTRSRG